MLIFNCYTKITIESGKTQPIIDIFALLNENRWPVSTFTFRSASENAGIAIFIQPHDWT